MAEVVAVASVGTFPAAAPATRPVDSTARVHHVPPARTVKAQLATVDLVEDVAVTMEDVAETMEDVAEAGVGGAAMEAAAVAMAVVAVGVAKAHAMARPIAPTPSPRSARCSWPCSPSATCPTHRGLW